MLTFHHVLVDGWSLSSVLGEVFTTYRAVLAGGDPCLPARRPYRDFVAWSLEADSSEAEAVWRQELAGFTEPTWLRVDRVREASRLTTPERVEQVRAEFPEDMTRALWSSRNHHLTLNTIVQGAWAALLMRYSGSDDVVFGATVSGRPPSLPGVETMIGLFINTHPVRARSSGVSTLAWLEDLQRRQVELRDHEQVSLSEIHAWSDVPPDRPLFSTLVVYENYPLDAALRDDDMRMSAASTMVVSSPTIHSSSSSARTAFVSLWR